MELNSDFYIKRPFIFSKEGKSAGTRFHILEQADDILSGKTKKASVEVLPGFTGKLIDTLYGSN